MSTVALMFARKLSLCLIVSSITILMVNAQQSPSQHTISINGRDLYYEKSGEGHPLLLLHGWTQTSAFWEPYRSQFETQYEVYAIDLRGHGRSAPLTKDFSIQQVAGDIEQLIEKLKFGSVKAIGLSYGGLVLLELASSRKGLLEQIVVMGTAYRYNGRDALKDKPAFSYESLDSSFVASLKQQHVHGESQIKALFNPQLDYQIHLMETQLKTMQTEVFLINGDSDEIAGIQQAVEMRQLIPRSRLWIIPNTGHLALTEQTKELFIGETKAFFSSSK